MAIQIRDHKRIFHKFGDQLVIFEIANEDTDGSTYQYYGYISSSGAWIIQRFHVLTNAIVYEYSAGKTRTDYDGYWNAAGRYIGSLDFTTFDAIGDNL